MGKLSDTKIRSAKARTKTYKIFDSDGLFIVVTPGGGRWWRMRYHWQGREQLLSLGTYPKVKLERARKLRDDIRSQVANGINPSTDRKEQKAARRDASERAYEKIAGKWLEQTATFRKWTPDHVERVRRRQEVHLFPWIGSKAVAEITDDDVLGCLRRIVDRGLIDTAHRARAETDAVFRYAKKWKLTKSNPVADLRDADVLPKLKVTHNSAIVDPDTLGVLLRAIEAYPGGFVVKCALKLQALVFTRPGELRLATWQEFDLDRAEWRIPAPRMKMREQHIVPLSHQAVAILRELEPLTGPDGFVFPQVRNASRRSLTTR